MTIVPEYLLTGNEDNDRLIKWFIAPGLIVNLALMGLIPEFRTAGIIYLIFSLIGWVLYWTPLPRLQKILIGVKKDVVTGVGTGIIGAIIFFVIQAGIPSFSLGVPSLPLALADSIKGFIIIGIAPVMEEIVFRGGVLAILMGLYGWNFWKANVAQAGLFSLEHFVAYGIFLGQLEKWGELYGQFAAISGLFVAAFVFGLFSGYLVHKTKNLLPGMITHSIINAILWTAGYVIIYCIGCNLIMPWAAVPIIIGIVLVPMVCIFIKERSNLKNVFIQKC